jgi:hypothetical protein
MGKVNVLQYAFNVGEMSKAGMARIDQERVKLAAETQENVLPYTIGKGLIRPGTGYLGNTASNAQARLIPFAKSIDEQALLEFTNAKLRVWVDDALVTRPSVTSTIGNGTFSIASATVTITIATPGVISWASHPFVGGEQVSFKTTGALPTGITAGTIYYVLAAGLVAGTSFRIAATDGGAAINTSGSQSGTHTGDASWVTTVTGSATSQVASSRLTLKCPNRGGTALAKQAVTTSSLNTVHAINITVDRGPVTFRCGSTDGGDEYIAATELDEGLHSLAFTPTASPYYIRFFTRSDIEIRISSVAIASAGVMELTAPWTTAQLRQIRTDQSLDVMYLAHTSWQQRLIERRGDASWSLVKYKANDGPFTTGATADVLLTPGALNGNTTLTSDQPFFSANHVGSLIRVFHTGQKVSRPLADDDQYTDSVKVTGLGSSDRTVTLTISGTWVGTVTLQRSYDGPDSGFIDLSSTASVGNGTSTSTDSPTLDNIDVWYRFGFGETRHTSGVATASVDYAGGGGWGVARVVAFNSSTSVDIEVLSPFTGLLASKVWREGAWSDANGWPSAVSLFDGRLWWARDDRFWGSESDDYTAFNLETVGDAGSIQRSIATGGAVNTTHWLLPLQRLIFGTDGSEASARSSNFDQPLTPTLCSVKDASTQGSAAVSPAKLDGRGVFVQRSGTQVYEVYYSLDKQDYTSTCLTKFHEDIGSGGMLELAVQRQPQSYLWSVRADGECPVLLYDPQEQVAGWFRFIAAASLAGDAEVESVAVLPQDEQDAVYLSVKRTINGSTVRFIERLMKHADAIRSASIRKMADAGTLTAGSASSVTLAHLASETGLVGWATNSDGDQVVLTGLSADASGVIALGATYTNIWVGLKYDWRYKSAKLAYGSQGGTALLQRKRVRQVGLLAADLMYGAIQFGPDFDTMDPLPLIKDGTDVSQTEVYEEWDEPSFPFRGGWDTDSRLCLKGSAPYVGTLLGIVAAIDTHET